MAPRRRHGRGNFLRPFRFSDCHNSAGGKEIYPATAAKFILRRFARIYPAYLCAILATWLLTVLIDPVHAGAVLAALPGLLTFTDQPQWIGLSFGILWTLQVEMWFYVAIPIAMLALGRERGLVFYCALVIAVWVTLRTLQFPVPRSLPGVVFWTPALTLGAAVSLAWKRGWLDELQRVAIPLTLLGLVGVAVLLPISPDPRWRWFPEVMAASFCGCALIAAFIMQPDLPVSNTAAFVGRISYSLYLVHGIVINFFLPQIHLVRLSLYVVLLFGISTVSYYFIEKPGIRIGKRLSRFLFKT